MEARILSNCKAAELGALGQTEDLEYICGVGKGLKHWVRKLGAVQGIGKQVLLYILESLE